MLSHIPLTSSGLPGEVSDGCWIAVIILPGLRNLYLEGWNPWWLWHPCLSIWLFHFTVLKKKKNELPKTKSMMQFLLCFSYKSDTWLSDHNVSLSLIKLESESCSVMSDSFDPMDCSLRGILQARILEWVAIPFSRGSSWPSDWTQISHTAGRCVTIWATRKALKLERLLSASQAISLSLFLSPILTRPGSLNTEILSFLREL